MTRSPLPRALLRRLALMACLAPPLPAQAESLLQADALDFAARVSNLARLDGGETLAEVVENPGPFTMRLARYLPRLTEFAPLIEALATGDAGQRVIAQTLTARLIWAAGAAPQARAAYLAALETATAAGLGDREIGFLLADLAVLDAQAGDAAAAAEWMARVARCGAVPCPFDLLRQLAETPPDTLTDPARGEVDRMVDRFLTTALPDQRDTLWATHLRRQANSLEESYPIEASDYAERAYYLNRDTRTALAAMWLALKVNRFATVGELAADFAARVDEATLSPQERLTFRRTLARAKMRSGDRTAAADYAVIADLAIAALAGDRSADGFEAVVAEAAHLLLDITDSTNTAAALRLLDALMVHQNTVSNWTIRARLLHRQGDSAAAAQILRDMRKLDWITDWTRRLFTVQEAAYLRAAGSVAVAEALLSTLPTPDFTVPEVGVALPTDTFALWPPIVTEVIDQRDAGNHEGAAFAAAETLRYVPTIAARGTYTDAQILWQIAFTLARGGQPAAAFPVMTRAAAIAARLSFAEPTGVEGGTLQLLQRDNVRYLLFLDIAWAAARGVTAEEMMVFSRY